MAKDEYRGIYRLEELADTFDMEEPVTLIARNSKDRALRDVWEVAFDPLKNKFRRMAISKGVSVEVAENIARVRGGNVEQLDAVIEI